MEDVCEQWSSLNLDDEDDDVWVVADEEVCNNSISGVDILFGKLLCSKKYNKKKSSRRLSEGFGKRLGMSLLRT